MSTDFGSQMMTDSAEGFLQSMYPQDYLNDASLAPDVEPGKARVCDRCISKKVKCDTKRPSCSRCLEASLACVYSTAKRKPGPVKGSRKRQRDGVPHNGQPTSDESASSLENPTSKPFWLSEPAQGQDSQSSNSGNSLHPASSPEVFRATQWPPPFSQPAGYAIPGLSFEQERELMEMFVAHIHPAVPLFREPDLMRYFDLRLMPQELILTIIVLVAKLLGRPHFWSETDLEQCYNYLRDRVHEEPDALNSYSLQIFRIECLLVYYFFHQNAGDKAMLRMNALARKAYSCGVHRVDSEQSFDRCSVEHVQTEQDRDDWRRVWWCIFCFDSYANMSAALPFAVDVESMRVSLLVGSNTVGKTIFLPDETGLLWQTVKEIEPRVDEFNFNIHIITTRMLREAFTMYRLCLQNPSPRKQARLSELDHELAKLRLALPPYYMSTSRAVLQNESQSAHHARLICLLHLLAARFSLYLGIALAKDSPQAPEMRLRLIEVCQEVVSVVEQWNNRHSSSIDPAICIIIFTALNVLNVYGGLAADQDESVLKTINQQKDVLILFLEQLSAFWQLPRSLAQIFRRMGQHVPTEDDLRRYFVAPLHPAWLRYMDSQGGIKARQSTGLGETDPGQAFTFPAEWETVEWPVELDFSLLTTSST